MTSKKFDFKSTDILMKGLQCTSITPVNLKVVLDFKKTRFYKHYRDEWCKFIVIANRINATMIDPSKIKLLRGHVYFDLVLPYHITEKMHTLIETYLEAHGWTDLKMTYSCWAHGLDGDDTTWRVRVKPSEEFEDALSN